MHPQHPNSGTALQEQDELPEIDFRKNYLPGLDTLRCIAASLVVFGHVDSALYLMGQKQSLYKFFPFFLGDKAVVFFFVLSGFLITYLLLKEKEVQPISLRNFYLRRIFRIWPVYFIVAATAVFVMARPSDFTTTELVCLSLISPNIGLLFYPEGLGMAIHTWSIGVEEQFYLMWPLVIRKKNYLKYILYIYAGITLLSNGLIGAIFNMPFIPRDVAKVFLYINKFFTFEYSFRIDAMAIGAIGAYILFSKKTQILKLIFSKQFQYVTYVTLAVLLAFPWLFPYQFHNCIYLSVIMNVSFNPNSLLTLNNKITTYIGKISYGVYMYHFLFLGLVINWCINTLGMGRGFINEIIISLICLAVSVGVSSLSYHVMEVPIMRLKKKFADHKPQKAL